MEKRQIFMVFMVAQFEFHFFPFFTFDSSWGEEGGIIRFLPGNFPISFYYFNFSLSLVMLSFWFHISVHSRKLNLLGYIGNHNQQ